MVAVKSRQPGRFKSSNNLLTFPSCAAAFLSHRCPPLPRRPLSSFSPFFYLSENSETFARSTFLLQAQSLLCTVPYIPRLLILTLSLFLSLSLSLFLALSL